MTDGVREVEGAEADSAAKMFFCKPKLYAAYNMRQWSPCFFFYFGGMP
jgi:hypothetical protein